MGRRKKTVGGKRKKKADDELEYVGHVEADVHPLAQADKETTPLDDPEETQPEEDQETIQPQEHEEAIHTEKQQSQDQPQSDTAAVEGGGGVEEPRPKKHRGPTKMKDIARDPNTRIRVDFTELGEPCGPGSVKLSSYLGPLVREHVPVLIDDWRKIGEDLKTVLWKSVKARFELDGIYDKASVMKQMGCLWRASKSRLVRQIRDAKNHVDRMKLRPKNIPPAEWRKFVKLKTSEEFKVVSDHYKERRSNQIPHTCSRRGMVRLAEDLKKECGEPSKVTRLKVWVRSRTKKDGTPVNTNAAEKIKKASELVESSEPPSSISTNPREDMLSQVLGPDNPGRLRAMGRGMTVSKLACFEVKSRYMAEMQQKQVHLEQQVQDLQEALAKMRAQNPEPEIGENSAPRSVNKKSQPKCLLFDWSGTDNKVGEGRILSSEPEDYVNDVPLGPNSVKVLVETANKPNAFLWRPAPNMFTIGEAVGGLIAWPESFAVPFDQDSDTDEQPKTPSPNPLNNCRLLDWATNSEEIVAEGRWQSRDPKALVNGLPLGPNAVKVLVDVVIEPDIFLWRPTAELSNLKESLKSFVAWPANRVVFYGPQTTTGSPTSPHLENSEPTPGAPIKSSQPSSQSPLQSSPQIPQEPKQADVVNENQKCFLMDISGKKQVVAEGRWSSNDPEQTVHFKPLGPNAVRVWVDVVKVKDAPVWRPSSFIESLEDALGTTIAWPEDKVVLV